MALIFLAVVGGAVWFFLIDDGLPATPPGYVRVRLPDGRTAVVRDRTRDSFGGESGTGASRSGPSRDDGPRIPAFVLRQCTPIVPADLAPGDHALRCRVDSNPALRDAEDRPVSVRAEELEVRNDAGDRVVGRIVASLPTADEPKEETYVVISTARKISEVLIYWRGMPEQRVQMPTDFEDAARILPDRPDTSGAKPINGKSDKGRRGNEEPGKRDNREPTSQRPGDEAAAHRGAGDGNRMGKPDKLNPDDDKAAPK